MRSKFLLLLYKPICFNFFELISVNQFANFLNEILRRQTNILFFDYFVFCCDQKAKEAASVICNVYGIPYFVINAIAQMTAQDWFSKFKNGNFDLDDTLSSLFDEYCF